jgi:hypothetical protein
MTSLLACRYKIVFKAISTCNIGLLMQGVGIQENEVIHKDYLVLLNPDPLHKPVVCMGYRKIEKDALWIDQNAKTWSRCSDIPD